MRRAYGEKMLSKTAFLKWVSFRRVQKEKNFQFLPYENTNVKLLVHFFPTPWWICINTLSFIQIRLVTCTGIVLVSVTDLRSFPGGGAVSDGLNVALIKSHPSIPLPPALA